MPIAQRKKKHEKEGVIVRRRQARASHADAAQTAVGLGELPLIDTRLAGVSHVAMKWLGFRWAIRLFALAILSLGGFVWVNGCEHRVVAPVLDAPMTRVLLVDYAGQHCSIVFPRPGGAAVEYSYGEWEWFAFGRTSLWRAPLIMMLPSRGTLGKREFDGPYGMHEFARVTTEPGWNIIPLDVPTDRVNDLVAGLDHLYAKLREGGEVFYKPYETYFVLKDSNYWMFNNCHHVTASWLRELGCRTEKTAIFEGWQVIDAPRTVRHTSPPSTSTDQGNRASDARDHRAEASAPNDG